MYVMIVDMLFKIKVIAYSHRFYKWIVRNKQRRLGSGK